jgi:hypothetical protein
MFHLQDAILANRAPRQLPSSVLVLLVIDLSICPGLLFHTFRPTWSLPIASRLSLHLRFANAHSEELSMHRVHRTRSGPLEDTALS